MKEQTICSTTTSMKFACHCKSSVLCYQASWTCFTARCCKRKTSHSQQEEQCLKQRCSFTVTCAPIKGHFVLPQSKECFQQNVLFVHALGFCNCSALGTPAGHEAPAQTFTPWHQEAHVIDTDLPYNVLCTSSPLSYKPVLSQPPKAPSTTACIFISKSGVS